MWAVLLFLGLLAIVVLGLLLGTFGYRRRAAAQNTTIIEDRPPSASQNTTIVEE